MQTPRELRDVARKNEDVLMTRREDDGDELVAIDFGADVDASLNLVGDRAIVVAGDRQFEFQVPADASDVDVNDGIVTLRS